MADDYIYESAYKKLKIFIGPVLVSCAILGAIGFAVYYFSPAFDTVLPFVFALKCGALATFSTLLTAIEAVAHERLQSNAFNPLEGHESRRLKINLRYLQNTIEQLILFVTGLTGISFYLDPTNAAKILLALTVTWILSRFVFWVGYHKSAEQRIYGVTGMLLNLLMLLCASVCFAYEIGGYLAALIVVMLFTAIEFYLVRATVRTPR